MAEPPTQDRRRLFGGERYEVLSVLGTGGTATVYRVYDRSLDVERALKVLRVGDAEMARRLASEAKMMVRIDNPHILRVVDVGEDEGRPYLVMEFLGGGTLADLGEQGPLPVRSALEWTLQILAALGTAHELGIVHRDVKPSNVLLDKRGVAHLADFGIALRGDEREERKTRTGVAMGTLAFMAPEQRLDARAVGPSADLYAVGATLYALLTYRSPMDLFVVREDDPRMAGVPPKLASILLKATRYQPGERYTSAAEMAAPIWDLVTEFEEKPLFEFVDGDEPPQRIRTATPGPLGARLRPPPDVTAQAMKTLTRTASPATTPSTLPASAPFAVSEPVDRPTLAPQDRPAPTITPFGQEDRRAPTITPFDPASDAPVDLLAPTLPAPGTEAAEAPADPPRRRAVWVAVVLGALVPPVVLLVLWIALAGERSVEPTAPDPAVATRVETEPAPEPVVEVAPPAEPEPEPVPEPVVEPEPVPAAAPTRVAAVSPRPQPAAPAPVAAPVGPFPVGAYVGTLNNRVMELRLSGAPDALRAEVTTWFSARDRRERTDNYATRVMEGSYSADASALVLRDTGSGPGMGAIEARWERGRFRGRFATPDQSHVSTFEAQPE